MAVAAKRLVSGSVLTTAPVSYYTAGASTSAIIQKATFTNLSGAAAIVNAWLVPSGGAPGGNYQINITVGASVSVGSTELARQVIEPGGQLYMQATPGGVIAAIVSGAEIT